MAIWLIHAELKAQLQDAPSREFLPHSPSAHPSKLSAENLDFSSRPAWQRKWRPVRESAIARKRRHAKLANNWLI
jgi:hypothetical protein